MMIQAAESKPFIERQHGSSYRFPSAWLLKKMKSRAVALEHWIPRYARAEPIARLQSERTKPIFMALIWQSSLRFRTSLTRCRANQVGKITSLLTKKRIYRQTVVITNGREVTYVKDRYTVN
jgi:hypothetical protein